jgi:hypothetical protein
MIHPQHLITSLLLFVLAVPRIFGLGEDALEEVAGLKLELPTEDCTQPDNGHQRHEKWIKKLNGRRIVFLGDSPLRYDSDSLRCDCLQRRGLREASLQIRAITRVRALELQCPAVASVGCNVAAQRCTDVCTS